MNKLKVFLLAAALAACGVATATLYPLFGPSAGILKGVADSPQTSAATASDVVGLWSGTCSDASWLRGDESCSATLTGSNGTVGFDSTGSALNFGYNGANDINATGSAASINLVTHGGTALAASADTGIVLNGATGGDKGSGTINAAGVYVNGTAVGGSLSPANPTGTVGLTAVDGSASTYMRSDAAPALSMAISPTWTGNHTFAPSSGTTTIENMVDGYALTIDQMDTGSDIGVGMRVNRPDSIANSVREGAVIELVDSANNTYTLWQQAGGQSELWQYDGSWAQVLRVTSSNQVQIPDSAGTMQNAGYLGCPINTESTTYTLQLSDRGKCINPSASFTITIPASTFSAGDSLTIVSCCGNGNTTISGATGVTIVWANGSGATGSRTINDGIATLWFYDSSVAIITGSGIS